MNRPHRPLLGIRHDQRTRLETARADVDEARRKVTDLRRLVAERKAGASALHLAEYERHEALRRLDLIERALDPNGDPKDAA